MQDKISQRAKAINMEIFPRKSYQGKVNSNLFLNP